MTVTGGHKPLRDLTEKALDKVRSLGASYGDIRIVEQREEAIEVKNGKVEGLSSESDYGFGIRVIADGAWGFASSLDVSPEEIERVAEMAVRIAKASASIEHEPVELAPVEPAEGKFAFGLKTDPFEVLAIVAMAVSAAPSDLRQFARETFGATVELREKKADEGVIVEAWRDGAYVDALSMARLRP